MTIEYAKDHCTKLVRHIESLCGMQPDTIDVRIISDRNGHNFSGSYMEHEKLYPHSTVYINIVNLDNNTELANDLAHELIHALMYRIEHYHYVAEKCVTNKIFSALDLVFQQSIEATTVTLTPILEEHIMRFWKKGKEK